MCLKSYCRSRQHLKRILRAQTSQQRVISPLCAARFQCSHISLSPTPIPPPKIPSTYILKLQMKTTLTSALSHQTPNTTIRIGLPNPASDVSFDITCRMPSKQGTITISSPNAPTRRPHTSARPCCSRLLISASPALKLTEL